MDEAKRLSSTHTLTGGHRGFDILHVAASIRLKAKQFLTFDGHQKKLAEAEGLIKDAWHFLGLVKIVYLDNGSTSFEYDGMDQRRIITERDAGGSVQSVTRLLWKDGRVWQEQDTQGRVTRRYFFNGAQTLTYTGAQTTPASTSSVLTTTDHLGSMREAVTFGDDGVQITGRREYDPYGRLEQSGEVPTRASYTGHWHHERSGLELALYRAYDAEMGRWLKEDPLEDAELIEGPNLYGYVGNSPLMEIDPLGLFEWWEAAIWIDDHGGRSASNFAGGFSNDWLLGVPEMLGAMDGADKCSTAYKVGGWTSFGIGASRLAYAGLAKGGAKLASSGAQASAFRTRIGNIFRSGSERPYQPNLAGKTDAMLRASAGKTNWKVNAAAAAKVAESLYRKSKSECP